MTASKAREHAYLPHSTCRVGVALMCTDGTIVKGTSVDNTSYGVYSDSFELDRCPCTGRLTYMNAIVRICLLPLTHFPSLPTHNRTKEKERLARSLSCRAYTPSASRIHLPRPNAKWDGARDVITPFHPAAYVPT